MNRIQALRRRIRQPGPNRQATQALARLRTRSQPRPVARRPAAPTARPNVPVNRPIPWPRPSPVPFSGTAETQIAGLNRDYNDTTAALTAQQLGTEQSYGFTDTSNPFNRAAMLQQAYDRNRAKTQTSYAARGQLYAGSLSNARSYDEGNYLRGYDALARQYRGELGDIAAKRLAASRTLSEGTQAARAKALEEALNEPTDPTEAPPGRQRGGGRQGGGGRQNAPQRPRQPSRAALLRQRARQQNRPQNPPRRRRRHG